MRIRIQLWDEDDYTGERLERGCCVSGTPDISPSKILRDLKRNACKELDRLFRDWIERCKDKKRQEIERKLRLKD